MVSHSLMQYFLHLVLPGATSDAKVLLWEENKRKEKVSFYLTITKVEEFSPYL